jgi:hypothetical protein
MEKIKKETFIAWTQKHDWLLVGENGLQSSYLTATGELVIIKYTLDGYLESVGKMMPMPQPQPHISGLDLRGGGRI